MTKRNSLTAALAALSLLWVFALPATAADPEAGVAQGDWSIGSEWSTECTDTGQGEVHRPWWKGYFGGVGEDEGVWSIIAAVTSADMPTNPGTLRLCGNMTRDSSDDVDVHVALGAACTVVGPTITGISGGRTRWPAHFGDDGRGQMDFPGRYPIQIRNLRFAPTLTGQYLATADYATLPAGPAATTGVMLMQFGGNQPSNTCFPLYGEEGAGWWSWNSFWATFELIPTS